MGYIGIGFRRTRGTTVLDVHYPIILEGADVVASCLKLIGESATGIATINQDQYQALRDTHFLTLPIDVAGESDYHSHDVIVCSVTDLQAAIESTEEAYFKLQLLSQRLVKPHGQNLGGIFGQLPNIAWSSIGPILPEDVPSVQVAQSIKGTPLTITHVDKFPYMVNYHVPSGVRIADGSRVRLGAYLGEGTTIMPAGFVNFNAGTLGNAMIEGRISAGVVVGEDSDVGGGASIMGTLSGGNDHVISVGKKCLLGANSGIGISLGDGCTVAAGLYVTAGKKITLVNESNQPVNVAGDVVSNGENIVKAAELSGSNFRLFIEDSQTGEIICKPNTKVIQLNEALHSNT